MTPIYSTVGDVGSMAPTALQSVSALNSGTIAMFIGGVDAEINGKIGKRYALPLTVTCPILQQISIRETIYRIMIQRQLIHFPPAQQGRHPLQQQHIDDQKLLEQIMDGEVQLITTSNEVVAAALDQTEIWSNNMNYVPTMDEGAVDKQRVDPDKIQDIDANKGYPIWP